MTFGLNNPLLGLGGQLALKRRASHMFEMHLYICVCWKVGVSAGAGNCVIYKGYAERRALC